MLPAISKSSSRFGWLIAVALLLAALPGAVPTRAAESIKTYSTVQDFTTTCAGGPQFNDTVVTEDSNGEIALRASLEDYFYTGPLDSSKWFTGTYALGTPSFAVAGGQVTITSSAGGGGYVRSLTTQQYGRLEANVTFSNGEFQHFGWADPNFNYYIMFSTLNTTGQLYTRTQNGSGEITTLVDDPLTTSPLSLAIEWSNNGGGNDIVRYYINSALVHTDTVSSFPPNQLQIVLSNNTTSSVQDLSAGWIRYTPYAVNTGTYLSCPFSETGTPILTWGPIAWTASIPALASLIVEAQTSNDASTWTPLVAVANNVTPNIPNSKYIRYKLTLGTTDPNVAPKLEVISIKYRPQTTITIGDATLAEDDSGTANMNFTISLSEISYHDVTVEYATVNDTATAASNDYTTTSDTLTIPAGSLTGTISVPIKGDTIVESNETFFVNLSNPTRATIADAQAVGTITNDDSTEISIDDASLAEGNSGTANMTFTVSLSYLSDSPVQVNYATANSSATAPSDYTTTSGVLTIPALSASATISVPIKGDATVEPNETFFVNLTTPSGATIADTQATGTITNDDGATISIDDVSLAEGNSGTANMIFTVSLSNPSVSTVQVNYTTADDTASGGSDYTATSGTLTFPIGDTTQTITVTVNGDTTVEQNETFFVNLNSPSGATIADNQGIGTITNDDAPPPPNIIIDDPIVTEGNTGTRNISFTVSLSAASSSVVQVNYATANNSATAPGDYTAKSGTLSFPIGTTVQTITVTVKGDTTVEQNETFFVNLTSPSGGVITDAQGLGAIINDDGSTISIGDVGLIEGNSGSKSAVFAVSLSQSSASVIQVHYATANDSATAGSDYTAASGTLTFPANTTVQTLTVSVNGDTLVEPNEAFFVNLDNAVGATIASNQGIGTIANDDSATITLSNPIVTEGNSGTSAAIFTVTLSAPSASAVTVAYAMADSSATAGSDYTAVSGTLTFPAGTTTRTITVQVIGDTVVEGNEVFFINLSNSVGATIADSQGIGTILNDDSSQHKLYLPMVQR
jgi:hypothetical protein